MRALVLVGGRNPRGAQFRRKAHVDEGGHTASALMKRPARDASVCHQRHRQRGDRGQDPGRRRERADQRPDDAEDHAGHDRGADVACGLAARGKRLAAFDGRCIPTRVAPRSNTPGILGRRALSAGRLAVSVRRQTFTTGC
jgi:hypothetical protein